VGGTALRRAFRLSAVAHSGQEETESKQKEGVFDASKST
jgi:hypothetical protein